MRRAVALLLSVVLLAGGAAAAHGDEQAPTPALSLAWSTFAAGAGSTDGGAYHMSATAGQPLVGSASGGSYFVAGGFWAIEVEPLPPVLYLPLVEIE